MDERYRLMINGGVLSPGELKYICEAAEALGLDAISFGSRQDIIFPEKIDELVSQGYDSIYYKPTSGWGNDKPQLAIFNLDAAKLKTGSNK